MLLYLAKKIVLKQELSMCFVNKPFFWYIEIKLKQKEKIYIPKKNLIQNNLFTRIKKLCTIRVNHFNMKANHTKTDGGQGCAFVFIICRYNFVMKYNLCSMIIGGDGSRLRECCPSLFINQKYK